MFTIYSAILFNTEIGGCVCVRGVNSVSYFSRDKPEKTTAEIFVKMRKSVVQFTV